VSVRIIRPGVDAPGLFVYTKLKGTKAMTGDQNGYQEEEAEGTEETNAGRSPGRSGAAERAEQPAPDGGEARAETPEGVGHLRQNQRAARAQCGDPPHSGYTPVLSDWVLADSIAGVILGTAIGDALGWPVEFMSWEAIQSRYGEFGIRELPDPALYTDDTQMMRAVLDGLLRARPRSIEDLDRAAEEVAESFIAWLRSPENNRAPGNSCLSGCRNLEEGVPWRSAGMVGSTGCGTAMRSMAYGIWFFDHIGLAGQMAAEHAVMTHQSDEARAAAAAVAAAVAAGIRGLSRWGMALIAQETAGRYHVPTMQLLERAMCDAGAKSVKTIWVLDKWRGWTGAEAVAASLFCFLRHRSYQEAVRAAVNSPGDSDSLGAITGAFAGAEGGLQPIPADWVHRIEKREELKHYVTRIMRDIKECRGDSKEHQG
jgi:ADP-ribosylglycohydrolase